MAHSYRFAVLRAIPDARKGEVINVGIVVFHSDTVDVRLAPSLNKLLALDGSIDVDQIRELTTALGQWTSRFDTVEQKYDAIRHFGIVTVSELGNFELFQGEAYEDAISRMLRLFVLPRPRETAVLPVASRLTTNLKLIFQKQAVLGKTMEDIHSHLIVPNFPIDAEENLYVDFALRNGAYWITETADFRAKSQNVMDHLRIASLASVKINKARKRFRGTKVNSFVVYAAHGVEDVQSQLNLMSEYVDELVNLEDRNELARYTNKILRVAGHNRQL